MIAVDGVVQLGRHGVGDIGHRRARGLRYLRGRLIAHARYADADGRHTVVGGRGVGIQKAVGDVGDIAQTDDRAVGGGQDRDSGELGRAIATAFQAQQDLAGFSVDLTAAHVHRGLAYPVADFGQGEVVGPQPLLGHLDIDGEGLCAFQGHRRDVRGGEKTVTNLFGIGA